jgi:deazaflavin-dependent oxidoreductase (nitroreductase family)
MTDSRPFYNKPTPMAKAMNAFVSWLASLGLMPGGTVTIETRGRKSGLTRSNAVIVVEVDGQRYLVAPRGETEWVRNVRAAGGEAVLRHGRRKAVRLEELPVEQRAAIIKPYLKKTAIATKSEFGLDPDADISEFERIAPKHPVFRIVE